MLQIKNLKKIYANHAVLNHVNLVLVQPRICLLGPNGSEKSTLLCIIAGLLEYEQGSVCLGPNEIIASARELRDHVARVCSIPWM